MADTRIWRSLLFVPANSWKMMNKAATEQKERLLSKLEPPS